MRKVCKNIYKTSTYSAYIHTVTYCNPVTEAFSLNLDRTGRRNRGDPASA